MIRFDNLPPEVMQAMCTPMHLILPASAATHTGALYLGSFSAILDPSLLTAHKVGALVQVLDAPATDNREDIWRLVHEPGDRDCGGRHNQKLPQEQTIEFT